MPETHIWSSPHSGPPPQVQVSPSHRSARAQRPAGGTHWATAVGPPSSVAQLLQIIMPMPSQTPASRSGMERGQELASGADASGSEASGAEASLADASLADASAEASGMAASSLASGAEASGSEASGRAESGVASAGPPRPGAAASSPQAKRDSDKERKRSVRKVIWEVYRDPCCMTSHRRSQLRITARGLARILWVSVCVDGECRRRGRRG
jgi:hypothetical protein